MGAPAEPDPVVLPEPPGEAFFFDDFEGGAVGTQPAAWDNWLSYVANDDNTPDLQQFALLDNQDCFRGAQCVHFHAEGATSPAMLTLELPPGMTRIYIRAFLKTSKQVGGVAADQVSNHETLIALRAVPNDGNNEIRFGGAKGALGFNIVGPRGNDAIAPTMNLWGTGPAITANEWHCVEVAYLNDNAQAPEARASVDGQEVRAVTAVGNWHIGVSPDWLTDMYREVVLGWQSFSPDPGNDLWMDEVVLSQSPIGCD